MSEFFYLSKHSRVVKSFRCIGERVDRIEEEVLQAVYVELFLGEGKYKISTS